MNEEERRRIGVRLAQARQGAQMSQEEVATLFGIKRQAVSKWEQGKSLPRSAEWYELGPLYGVSLDYLIYGIRTAPVESRALMAQIFRPSDGASEPRHVLGV